MRRFLLSCAVAVAVTLLTSGVHAQTPVAERLHETLTEAGVPIVGVTIGDVANKATWKVHPPTLQPAAQPIIDAFNAADPKHVRAKADTEVGADTVLSDLLAALMTHLPAIQAEIAAGTFKPAPWLTTIQSTARGLRRARKGV